MNAESKIDPASFLPIGHVNSEHPYNYVTGKTFLLYEGEATVSRKKNTEEKEAEPDGEKIQFKCELKITQQLSPPRLDWACVGDGIGKIKFGAVDIVSDYSFKGRVYSLGANRIAGTVVEPGVEKGGNHDLNKVVFYLPGWPYDLSSVLSWGDFEISLSENPGFVPAPAEGYSRDDIRLNGLGTIKRTDGAKFKKKAVEQVIDGLESFLSFAFNSWCPPMLIIGSSNNCAKSWELWRDSRASTRRESRGWFDEFHPAKQLELAVPGFVRLWEKPEWRTHLELVLDWLIESCNNSPSPAAAVAMSQIPIELLASVIVCDEHQLLTSDDFEKINTAARFRLLTSYLGIPNEIPDELQSLIKLAAIPTDDKKENTGSIKDAPSLLVNIRNSIIHPKDAIKKRCEKAVPKLSLETVQWEAAKLYWCYINLILLKVMDYPGKYAKRLSHYPMPNEIVQVPWAEEKEEV